MLIIKIYLDLLLPSRKDSHGKSDYARTIIQHLLLLLLLLKKVGSARLRESGIHPISPKTPAPQYQPIDRKKTKGKK